MNIEILTIFYSHIIRIFHYFVLFAYYSNILQVYLKLSFFGNYELKCDFYYIYIYIYKVSKNYLV